MEIKDKKGSQNSVADHLSCFHIPGTIDISDAFLTNIFLRYLVTLRHFHISSTSS